MMRTTYVAYSPSEALNDLAARAALLNIDEIAAEVES